MTRLFISRPEPGPMSYKLVIYFVFRSSKVKRARKPQGKTPIHYHPVQNYKQQGISLLTTLSR